jgi:hypothetical protein
MNFFKQETFISQLFHGTAPKHEPFLTPDARNLIPDTRHPTPEN